MEVVKRIPVVLAVVAISFTLAVPANAQAKDPFRPPPGAGAVDQPGTDPGGPSGGTSGGAPPAQPPGGGLPRTGLDYSLPVLLALGLMAAGASMRLTAASMTT